MNKNKNQSKQIVQSFFTNTDIFGIQPKLFFDQKTKYKTSFGGILSFVLLGIVILACWVYGKDLYFKENPNSITTEEATTHPERFNITKSTMNFSFGLTDLQWNMFRDESIFQVEYIQKEMTYKTDEFGQKQNVFKYTDLEAKPCTKEDFGIVEDYFHNLPWLEQLYCIGAKETDIEGDYGASRYTQVQAHVYPCRNSTESDIVCKPQEEIDALLSDGFWSAFTSDSVIDPKNFREPFQKVGRNIYGYSTNQMFSQIDLNFKNIYIHDNSGIIFDSWDEKRGLQYSSTYKNQKMQTQEKGKFLQFNLRFEKVMQLSIQRKYLNLAEVLANVGGVLKVLMLVFLVFSNFISEKYYNIQAVNTLFSFDQSHHDDQHDNKKNKQDPSDTEKNSQKKKESSVKKQKLSEQLSFKNIFGAIFPNTKEDKLKKEMLDYSVRKLSYHLDIKRILKKLIEIDKIKMLLLNEEQYQLFDYLPKPIITEDIIKHQNAKKRVQQENKFNKTKLEKSKKVNLLFEDNRTQQQKEKEAYLAYKKIMTKSELTNIDKKILNTMDTELKSLFDEVIESYAQEKDYLQQNGGSSIAGFSAQDSPFNPNYRQTLRSRNQSSFRLNKVSEVIFNKDDLDLETSVNKEGNLTIIPHSNQTFFNNSNILSNDVSAAQSLRYLNQNKFEESVDCNRTKLSSNQIIHSRIDHKKQLTNSSIGAGASPGLCQDENNGMRNSNELELTTDKNSNEKSQDK